MLIATIAYDVDRNLGRAYNRCFEAASPGDHVVFLDHDAMFTTPFWRAQLIEAIARNPQAGLFTAVTNRVKHKAQKLSDAPAGHSLPEHVSFGEQRRQRFGSTTIDISSQTPISGVVMCLSRETWERIGGFKEGFLGVDNRAHLDVVRAGLRVLLLPGLYVWHWYRGDGDMSHTKGAPRAPKG